MKEVERHRPWYLIIQTFRMSLFMHNRRGTVYRCAGRSAECLSRFILSGKQNGLWSLIIQAPRDRLVSNLVRPNDLCHSALFLPIISEPITVPGSGFYFSCYRYKNTVQHASFKSQNINSFSKGKKYFIQHSDSLLMQYFVCNCSQLVSLRLVRPAD